MPSRLPAAPHVAQHAVLCITCAWSAGVDDRGPGRDLALSDPQGDQGLCQRCVERKSWARECRAWLWCRYHFADGSMAGARWPPTPPPAQLPTASAQVHLVMPSVWNEHSLCSPGLTWRRNLYLPDHNAIWLPAPLLPLAPSPNLQACGWASTATRSCWWTRCARCGARWTSALKWGWCTTSACRWGQPPAVHCRPGSALSSLGPAVCRQQLRVVHASASSVLGNFQLRPGCGTDTQPHPAPCTRRLPPCRPPTTPPPVPPPPLPPALQELRLYTDYGRCCRPLFIVEDQAIKASCAAGCCSVSRLRQP